MDNKVFKKYKNGATVFVETGTYLGNAVVEAQKAGFKQCYSVEFHPEFWENVVKRFENDDTVEVFLGSSDECLKDLMPRITKKCLFWLDAHDTFGTGGGVPTYAELDILKEHKIKNHTIIIDDVPLYFGDGQELRRRILEINPDYEIEMIGNATQPDYIMVAYVKATKK